MEGEGAGVPCEVLLREVGLFRETMALGYLRIAFQCMNGFMILCRVIVSSGKKA